jgi:rhodanese-related sulfurtransferase
MTFKRVSPAEALALVREHGYAYLDVRSVLEFEQGHPDGAYNAPLVHVGPLGRSPNAEFVAVVEKAFAKDAPIVLGCRTSARSEHAAALLEQAGFTRVVVMGGGWAGQDDAFGRPEPGWLELGLPVSSQAMAGRSWEELRARA